MGLLASAMSTVAIQVNRRILTSEENEDQVVSVAVLTNAVFTTTQPLCG